MMQHMLIVKKAWVIHDAAYANCKYLAKRTVSDILKDKADEIKLKPKYDRYQSGSKCK